MAQYDLVITGGRVIDPETGLDEIRNVGINGEKIATAEELIRAIHSSQIGQTISLTFWRGQTKDTTYASLVESPPPP